MSVTTDPSEQARKSESVTSLVADAVRESRTLITTELALAKKELSREVAQAKTAGTALGVSVTLAISGVALLLVTLGVALGGGWVTMLIIGLCALAAAGVLALVARQSAPQKILGSTIGRVEKDVRSVKEHLS
jgi:Putative Actinobacterial Holin-X, holin superfamily III